MSRTRTTKRRHRLEVVTLQGRVNSPRIAMFRLCRAMARLAKLAFFLCVMGAIGYGVREGVKRGLLENDEFALRELFIGANPIMDAARFTALTGVSEGSNLFKINPKRIKQELLENPEFLQAEVAKEFPGTLRVHVVSRRPEVWISCPEEGILARDPDCGMLVDADGKLFPCLPGLLSQAATLPVIELPPGSEELILGRRLKGRDYRRCALLLHAAIAADPGAWAWIDVIRPHKGWGLHMVTRDATVATFGNGSLENEMRNFLAARGHAHRKGQRLATISLVGQRNVPVTFHGELGPMDVDLPGTQRETGAIERPEATPEVEETGNGGVVTAAEARPAAPPAGAGARRREADMRELLKR